MTVMCNYNYIFTEVLVAGRLKATVAHNPMVGLSGGPIDTLIMVSGSTQGEATYSHSGGNEVSGGEGHGEATYSHIRQ